MLKNNLFLKIISLLLAVLIWMYVLGEVDPITTDTVKDVPVQLQNERFLKEQNLTVKDTEDVTVSLTLNGQRSALSELQKSKIKLSADLEGCEVGENQLPVTIQLPEGITMEGSDGIKIQVEVEKIIMQKKPLEVVFEGKAPQGTEPGGISVKPKSVKVKGAESIVNTVAAVQVFVDVAEVTDELKAFYLSPMSVDNGGKPVHGVRLSAKTAEVRSALYYTKTVALKANVKGTVPKGYKLTSVEKPKKITIKGPKDFVQNIKQVIAVDTNISKVKSTTSFPIKLRLPWQLEVADQSKDLTIKIKVKKSS